MGTVLLTSKPPHTLTTTLRVITEVSYLWERYILAEVLVDDKVTSIMIIRSRVIVVIPYLRPTMKDDYSR